VFIITEFAMRVISRDRLKPEMGIGYSYEHLSRMEKAGLFPQSINLGPGRVAYSEDEINNWLQARADARKAVPPSLTSPEVRAVEIAALRREGRVEIPGGRCKRKGAKTKGSGPTPQTRARR
jgi:prophage regulatory protein